MGRLGTPSPARREGELQGRAGDSLRSGALADTVQDMQRTAGSRRWRSRLLFNLLFMAMSAGLALAYFSRGNAGIGWMWVVLAAMNAALSLFSWSRLRRHQPVS